MGRERLRDAALQNKPWLKSTGPRTDKGKQQARLNGKSRQRGSTSREQRRNEIRDVRAAIRSLQTLVALATVGAELRQ